MLINLAATLVLTGLGWSLQLVQLRILKPDQLARHRALNSRLMVLPMAAEFIAAVWLAIEQPAPAPISALILWIAVGIGTLQYSLLHRKACTEAIIRRMRGWNLLRTIAWSSRSLILLWIVRGPLGSN